MKKTPLQQVADLGGKDKLVDKLSDLLEKGEESKDELKQRLLAASNAKLLRLHGIASEIKSKFNGSREKLVEAILGKLNKVKDADYKAKMLSFTPGRLLDLYRSVERRVGGAKKKGKAA
jgi:hypothetical protein